MKPEICSRLNVKLQKGNEPGSFNLMFQRVLVRCGGIEIKANMPFKDFASGICAQIEEAVKKSSQQLPELQNAQKMCADVLKPPAPAPVPSQTTAPKPNTSSISRSINCGWSVEGLPPKVVGKCKLSSPLVTELVVGINPYAKLDTLKVKVNGSDLVRDTDYTLQSNNKQITIKELKPGENVIDVEYQIDVAGGSSQTPAPAPKPTTSPTPVNQVGYDIKGNFTSCPIIDTQHLICTQSYDAGDMYRDACEKIGLKAIMCGCHEFLCSGKIDFTAQVPTQGQTASPTPSPTPTPSATTTPAAQ
jgi:hypothetical protein